MFEKKYYEASPRIRNAVKKYPYRLIPLMFSQNQGVIIVYLVPRQFSSGIGTNHAEYLNI
jgi:hypothetical protein